MANPPSFGDLDRNRRSAANVFSSFKNVVGRGPANVIGAGLPPVTPTVTPTISLTPSITPTQTLTPTPSVTPTLTRTPTLTPTSTVTPTITPTPTVTPIPLTNLLSAVKGQTVVQDGIQLYFNSDYIPDLHLYYNDTVFLSSPEIMIIYFDNIAVAQIIYNTSRLNSPFAVSMSVGGYKYYANFQTDSSGVGKVYFSTV